VAKNIIARRREQGAICPRCKSPDYKMSPSEVFEGGKPIFICGSCGHSWQYGYNGGIYTELALQSTSQDGVEGGGS
jgi:transposase-like protein